MNCFICERKFDNGKLLRYHINSSHDTSILSCFSCHQQQCKRNFETLKSLYQHFRKCHKDDYQIHLNKEEISTEVVLDYDEELTEAIQDLDTEQPVEEAQLAYVLKLYGDINLTRETVNKLILNAEQLLLEMGVLCMVL